MKIHEEIQGLILVLIKAKKNLRIYPKENPMYRKILEDAHASLSSILEDREALVFQIKQNEMLVDGDVVYRNEDRRESLALLFFRDGIKQLSFHEGIPQNELEGFLEIISEDFERRDSDEDIVTLMWERDLQSIHYVLDESTYMEDDGYEAAAVEQAREQSAGEADVLRAYEDAFRAEDASQINIVPLTNEDLQNIIQELEEEPSEKILTLVHLFLSILVDVDQAEEVDEITDLLKRALHFTIGGGNLEAAVSILRQMRQAASTHPDHDGLMTLKKTVETFLNGMDFSRFFGELLDSGTIFSEDAIHEFTRFLDSRSIPHLITMLGELDTIASRKLWIRILVELGRKDIVPITLGLNDERWYVVRNIIYILRQIGDGAVIEHLREVITHPEIRVRKEAIQALGEVGAGDVALILKDYLSDPDESIRIAAAIALGQIGNPVAKKIILESIDDKGFRTKRYREKKHTFEALSKWKEPDVLDLMIRAVKKKEFLTRTMDIESRAAAVHSLGLMGDQKALKMLQKLAKSKSDLLSENAQSAIEKIKSRTNE